jgi:hypothetical protein
MKPAVSILLLYVGFTAGSLQVLAFKDRWEGLGVLIGVTMILLIVGMVSTRAKKPTKAMPKKNVVRKRSKAKSVKVVGRRSS